MFGDSVKSVRNNKETAGNEQFVLSLQQDFQPDIKPKNPITHAQNSPLPQTHPTLLPITKIAPASNNQTARTHLTHQPINLPGQFQLAAPHGCQRTQH